MATETQFEALLSDIEQSKTTRKQISKEHQKVRGFLKEHEDFNLVHRHTFLTGSQARHTAIRPKTILGEIERPDADVIVVTNHELENTPNDVIQFLRDILEQEFDLDEQEHTRSVGIYSGEVELDVVIVIAPSNSWEIQDSEDLTIEALSERQLYLPDIANNQWIETNPPKQIKWSTKVNDDTRCYFKPMVKLLKWWRRENSTKLTGRHPKGFVLECLIAECMPKDAIGYEDAFLKLLSNIKNKYGPLVGLKQVPCIFDPGVASNNVFSRVSFDEFESFYNLITTHNELAQTAVKKGDTFEALELWREIFGSRFPASENQKKAQDLKSRFQSFSLSGSIEVDSIGRLLPKASGNYATEIKPHKFYGGDEY